jgi:hypothetical protein
MASYLFSFLPEGLKLIILYGFLLALGSFIFGLFARFGRLTHFWLQMHISNRMKGIRIKPTYFGE